MLLRQVTSTNLAPASQTACSVNEQHRTEKLLADSDEWSGSHTCQVVLKFRPALCASNMERSMRLWLQLVRCGSGGKCKLHAGSGPQRPQILGVELTEVQRILGVVSAA